VQLHTQNGTIAADLSHTGAVAGDITIQNGTVALTIGDDTSCKLLATTVNGRVLMAGQKRSWIRRLSRSHSLRETLGNGGGTLKLAVQNGSVKIRHAKADSDQDDDDSDD
jgi:hypothetical protein